MNAQPIIADKYLPIEAERICRRVLNALLREDVLQITSKAQIYSAEAAPFQRQLPANLLGCQWLAVSHLGGGRLWLAVAPSTFMQRWTLHDLPLCWEEAGHYRWFDDLQEILALFYQDLAGEARQRFEAFAEECRIAIDHGIVCHQEKQRYFSMHLMQNQSDDTAMWVKRMLHYERLAAFLDHPLYPTARAKLGFNTEDLTVYGPEFQCAFRLHWLAVPKTLCRQHGNMGDIEDLPGFSNVGLAPAYANTHDLIPVHPFMWGKRLQGFLQEHGLDEQVLYAPKSYLQVIPTLSVRTVQLSAQPHLHLKLPLAIKTLGGLNIRTIKPGTIADGHTIQRMLAKIVSDQQRLQGRILLTDESLGQSVANLPFLGYIVRRYPKAIEQGTTVAVAGLLAETPEGVLVMEQLAERYFHGLSKFLDAYLDLTLRFHLVLWLQYGIALESNQQNSLLVLQERPPRLQLLLKDNDAPRIHPGMLAYSRPDLAAAMAQLLDRRILVEDELALAQMFTTITLQLNITVLLEGLAATGRWQREALYKQLDDKILEVLNDLELEEVNTCAARKILLESDTHYLKLLLTAATLQSKQNTGASDVNKYYGKTAPNPLRLL